MTRLREARLRPCAAGIRKKRPSGNAARRTWFFARTICLPKAGSGEQYQRRQRHRAMPVAIFAEASTRPPPRTTFSVVMPIERRNATMTTNSQSPNKQRVNTGLGRAWHLVTSFLAVAARSLPAAGV